MAGTNIQQWNPTQSNQESDAAYTADALRTSGIQVDNPFPSASANKLFYQLSTFLTAFANALVGKGYNIYDTSLSALTGVLANIQTNADNVASIVNVPFSPTANFNRALGQSFSMTLTGNLTAPTLTNLLPGQRIIFIFQQDGVGGRQVTWPPAIQLYGNPGSIDSTTPPNAICIQEFIVMLDGSSVRPVTGLTVT